MASTTLTGEAVGTTRVIRKPAGSSSVRYCDAVRSSPPGAVSITMSSNLPGCGASPSGNTISTSNGKGVLCGGLAVSNSMRNELLT